MKRRTTLTVAIARRKTETVLIIEGDDQDGGYRHEKTWTDGTRSADAYVAALSWVVNHPHLQHQDVTLRTTRESFAEAFQSFAEHFPGVHVQLAPKNDEKHHWLLRQALTLLPSSTGKRSIADRDVVVLSTDGSVKNGRGGWAWVSHHGHCASGYADTDDVYIMELTAVVDGLKSTSPGTTVRIYSDSANIVSSVRSVQHRDKPVQYACPIRAALTSELSDLMAHRQVYITWVPSHQGQRRNDEADAMAKRARMSGQTTRITGNTTAEPVAAQ